MSQPEIRQSKLISVKYLLFVITFLGLSISCLPSYSQSKTQTDTISHETDSIIKYLTPLEYAFMMHENTSWLIKSSIFINNYVSGSYINASIEKSIASSFTLNLGVEQSSYYNLYSGSYYIPTGGYQTSLETRWYYRSNKRIKENGVARNMSDNYLSVGVGYTRITDTENHYYSTYIKWGIQRRFLKYGHADIGIKAGIGYNSNEKSSPFLIFNTYTDFGLAITKDKYKLDSEKLCPVLKCYEAESFLIKSNLSNLLSVSIFNNYQMINIVPNIAFERKLGKSAFSVLTEFSPVLHYENRLTIIENERYRHEWWSLLLDFTLQGRWYYNLKRRMLQGKTGNGLSANYIAFGGRYRFAFSSLYKADIFSSNLSYSSFHITTGWQRLFSKHLYYDVQLGIEYLNSNSYTYSPKFNIAVGYRF